MPLGRPTTYKHTFTAALWALPFIVRPIKAGPIKLIAPVCRSPSATTNRTATAIKPGLANPLRAASVSTTPETSSIVGPPSNTKSGPICRNDNAKTTIVRTASVSAISQVIGE